MANQTMVLGRVRYMLENVCVPTTWTVDRVDKKSLLIDEGDTFVLKHDGQKKILKITHHYSRGGRSGSRSYPKKNVKNYTPVWTTIDNLLHVHCLVEIDDEDYELILVFDYSNSSRPRFEYVLDHSNLTSHGRGGGGN